MVEVQDYLLGELQTWSFYELPFPCFGLVGPACENFLRYIVYPFYCCSTEDVVEDDSLGEGIGKALTTYDYDEDDSDFESLSNDVELMIPTTTADDEEEIPLGFKTEA